MCAYWAATGRGPPTRSSATANETGEPGAVIGGRLAESAGATSQGRPKGATAPPRPGERSREGANPRGIGAPAKPALEPRHAPSTRPITASRRSRDAGRPAHAAGAVADAPRVAERGEDDAIPLGDTPLVRAAASADDPARRAADEERRRALEPEQERLHRVAEGVVPPAPVPADDPVAGDDHGHRIPAEGVADGAR